MGNNVPAEGTEQVIVSNNEASECTSRKAVLITGCSTGIGAALAQALSKSFIVIATCRREESVKKYLSVCLCVHLERM